MNERYPGTMGRTQGEMKDTRPARKAAARETEEAIGGNLSEAKTVAAIIAGRVEGLLCL
jgi:hypothetical protein